MNDDILPVLAVALKTLHNNPDGDAKWVEGVFEALEHARPGDYQTLRRRVGLASGIARLAELSDEDRAVAITGVFLEAAIDGEDNTSPKSARKWLQYLQLNEDWLGAALHIVRLIRFSEPAAAPAQAAAAIAAEYDQKAFVNKLKPLQALRTIRSEAVSESECKIADLLWSEEGQALCDRHFKFAGSDYELTAKDISGCLKLLKDNRKHPYIASEPPPVRLAWKEPHRSGAKQPGQGETPAVAPASDVNSDNFERRKQALRAVEADGAEPHEPVEEGPMDQQDTQAPEDIKAEEVAPSPEPGNDERDEDLQLLMSVRRNKQAAPPTEEEPEEDSMDNATPADVSGSDATEKLARLRAHLKQINTLTIEAQEMLRALEPDLSHVSSVMSELDQMVNRWKNERESNAA